ncbi:hypothetical protein [Paraburkholderia sp.]|uniref:hypothetical protein n=1 Tax=Paraburkholderia sp. TaxID=1926495 RepID=UPI003D6EBDD8
MNGDALSRAAAAALATLTAFALTACGPDEAASGDARSNASTAPAHDVANSFAANAAVIQPGPGATPTPQPSAGAAATVADAAPSPGQAASSSALPAWPDYVADNPVASVEASLAADSRQIAPVMHVAPGDESH